MLIAAAVFAIGLETTAGWGERNPGVTAEARESGRAGGVSLRYSSARKYNGLGFAVFQSGSVVLVPRLSLGEEVHYRSGGEWAKTSLRPTLAVALDPSTRLTLAADALELGAIPGAKSHVRTLEVENWDVSRNGRWTVGVAAGFGTWDQGHGRHYAISARILFGRVL